MAPKLYRFALYGRAAAGKTCILAALAMFKRVNPKGYVCTWIEAPPDVPRPTGEASTWKGDSRPVSYWRGHEWLAKATRELENGRLPPPNPLQFASRIRYGFDIPGPRAFEVELIDYSGELVKPTTEGDLAQHLHKQMLQTDGILVLAEAPRLGDETVTLAKELLLLGRAFALLKNQRQDGAAWDFPLALLINKWDRRGKLNYRHPGEELTRLKEFLTGEPQPAHLVLYQQLRNCVTDGNFYVAPVSALGDCAVDASGEERPKQTVPLGSFGLENPFVWLAQRKDALDLEKFQEDLPGVSLWRFWQTPLSKRAPYKLLRRRAELKKRFPRKSEAWRAVRATWFKLWPAYLLHWFLWGAVLLALAVGGETVWDSRMARQMQSVQDDPSATVDELNWAARWADRYQSAFDFQHSLSRVLVLGRSEAVQALQNIRDRKEQKFWKPVEQAGELVAQVEPAKEYKKHCPGGRHIAEVEVILRKGQLELDARTDKAALTECETTFASLPSDENARLAALEELGKRLSVMPKHPDAEANDQFERRTTLAKKVGELTGALKNAVQWKEFEQFYRSTLDSGDLALAAKLLVDRKARDDDQEALEQLKQHFPEQALATLERTI